MRTLMTLLFGEAGWFWWHAAVWLTLIPGLWVWWWLGSITPGAGPQGGLFAFMALFATLAGLTLIGLILAVRHAQHGSGVGKGILLFLGWLVVWGVVAWKLGGWANTASLADVTPGERSRTRLGYLVLLLLAGAAHLAALVRLRSLTAR